MNEATKLAIEALEKLWLLGDEAAAICNPALAALRAQPTGWQPIETAPKNDTDIIVMSIQNETQIVHNAFYETAKVRPTHMIGWWRYEFFKSVNRLHDSMHPTHWMPLPPAPEEK